MPTFSSFEEIDAWKVAVALCKEIYGLTREGGFNKDYPLRDQIRRSAISVPSNIAEGFERDTPNEFIRFLQIAKGSAGELRTQICIAGEVGYLEPDQTRVLLDKVRHVSALIAKLITYLRSVREKE